MQVRALIDFYDLREKVRRPQGELFEATPERLDEINATGIRKKGHPFAEAVEADEPVRALTKAELAEKAASLGLAVPAKATKAQIEELIAQAEG